VKLIDPPEPEQLLSQLNEAASSGLKFFGAAFLGDNDPGLAKIIDEARYLLGFSGDSLLELKLAETPEATLQALLDRYEAKEEVTVERDAKGIKRRIDVKGGIEAVTVGNAKHYEQMEEAGISGRVYCLAVKAPLAAQGAVRMRELVEALVYKDFPFIGVRTALRGQKTSPLALETHRRVPRQKSPAPAPEAPPA